MKYATILSLLIWASQSFAQKSQSYFQQEVNYTIDARLDDKSHYIHASVEMEYINHSPDTLKEIYMHLWPNAYKNAKSSLAKQLAREGDYFLYYSQGKDRGGIDSLNFEINNQPVSFSLYQNYIDIAKIDLPKPLAPGASMKISTPFRVKLPSGSISRLGHVGESYQITQWYPKPAVYDKNGWNPIPYLGQGEFYSEFGSFDVSITLPANYTVGATGDLQTASEVERLNALSQLPIPSKANNDFPASVPEMKTLRYTQKNVHDFGWFADKRWIVRKGEANMPSGRIVTTWAMFTPANAEAWSKGNEYIADGLLSYSQWVGEYPYDQCTAVDGTISAGGGMEYPNVTVIGSTSNPFLLAQVIVHEVGHNWFYGILGSNEREHGWMDEGINSFMETLTMESKFPEAKLYEGIMDDKIGKLLGLDKFPLNYQNELLYQFSSRPGKDQAISTSSEAFSSMNYGTIMYKKTGLAFNYLRNYLGDELFKKCMNTYFEEWKFKHPQPEDIEEVFERVSNKNLDWFFQGVITTDEPLDYKAEKFKFKGDDSELTVMNTGDVPAPFSVSLMREGKEVSKQWYEGVEAGDWTKVKVPGLMKGDVLVLNQDRGSLDIDRGNNNIRTKGIFKTREKLELDFLTGYDDPSLTRLFWMPVVGWNDYDRWMGGLCIHNRTVPLRKFEFAVTPMYSLSSRMLQGMWSVRFNGRRWNVGVRGQQFARNRVFTNAGIAQGEVELFSFYRTINPYVEYKFPIRNAINAWTALMRIDGFFNGFFSNYENNSEFDSFNGSTFFNSGVRLSASIVKDFIGAKLKLRPVYDNLFTDFGGRYSLARLSADLEYTYWKKKKRKLFLRTFVAGTGFGEDQQALPIGVSGTTGNADYFYNELFFARSAGTGLLSNQLVSDQGGLLIPELRDVFANSSVMSTVQIEADLPIKLPISIFGAMGFADENSPKWSAGVSLPIVRDVFQVYLPLVFDAQTTDRLDARGLNVGNYIMFELNLTQMNPFNFLR